MLIRTIPEWIWMIQSDDLYHFIYRYETGLNSDPARTFLYPCSKFLFEDFLGNCSKSDSQTAQTCCKSLS